jgi:hypothetical protein
MNNSQPEFLDKYDFNLESYANFISNGEPKSQLDEYGNLILNSNIEEPNLIDSDKFIIKVTAKQYKLDQQQVELFMNTELSEFQGQSETINTEQDNELVSDFGVDIDTEIRSQLQQETILRTQIDEMSDILDTEIAENVQFQEKSSENFSAAKDLIISQRISLGEGNTSDDFSDKFPFLPLNETQETSADVFPFMSS